MTVVVLRPREAPSTEHPEPPRPEPGVLMLASPVSGAVRRAGAVIFKVRDFDPSKHPRGYKGLFVDTPDKKAAGSARVGDVIATQSGKTFRVEAHGPKGIKVATVHQDTGEVLNKGTIVGNGIQVAVVQSAGAVGTRHAIGSLPPGTIVQVPKSGKRFEIGKHGAPSTSKTGKVSRNTTVYPVDAMGARAGKHTILPSGAEVAIASKQAGGPVTPSVVAQAGQVATAFAKQSPPAGRPLRTPPPYPGPAVSAPAAPAPAPSNRNPLRLKPGDQVKGKNTGTAYTVDSLDPRTGAPLAEDEHGILFEIDPAVYEKHVPEVLPQNLPRPPRPYAPGVGAKSALVLIEQPEFPGRGTKKVSGYEVRRVPDASQPGAKGDLVGTYPNLSSARKGARDLGAAHEAILEAKAPSLKDVTVQPGDWVLYRGYYNRVQSVEAKTAWAGPDDVSVIFDKGPHGARQTLQDRNTVYLGDASKYDDLAVTRGYGSGSGGGGRAYLESMSAHYKVDPELNALAAGDPTTLRAARENLYLPQLNPDWKPDDLLGKAKGDALAALRKLGYGEVTPREPNMTKMVNGFGKRLHVHNKGGVVTLVDEIQSQATQGGGTGFHAQLKAVLDSGGDVRQLDPSQDPNHEARTSHARQLLYDMALGKQQGVEKQLQSGSAKVKTDAAYEAEIRQDASFQSVLNDARNNADDPGVNVPVRADVMNGKWGQLNTSSVHLADLPSTHHATAAIAVGERNGIADIAKANAPMANVQNPAATANYEAAAKWLGDAWAEAEGGLGLAAFTNRGLSQGTAGYVMNTLADIKPRGDRQWEQRDAELKRRRDNLEQQAIADETLKRRKVEGTVATKPGSGTFELPLWDEASLKKQDIFEVEGLIQNAKTTDVVPVFFTGGIVKDGVAYGRKANSGRTEFHANVPKEFDRDALARVGGTRQTNSRWPTKALLGSYSGTSQTSPGHMYKLDEGGGKHIEYVPHGDGQAAPTNQRGRVTLVGYTPEEAAAKMKSLGLVHDLEEEVPFNSVLRSERRHGRVAPLHSDYVSGDVPLPTVPAPISHGMSSSNAQVVFDSGGLMPIADRFQSEIPLSGTIPANDIRAGVDHVVFAAMHGASYQSYGDMAVVYKDSAYLRRDVLVTDRAFGSGDTRYPSYRRYANAQRRAAGEKNTDDNIYVPLSPAARQAHINGRMVAAGTPAGLSANQNEWNVRGMPIEDMAVVFAPSAASKRQLDQQLDQMLRSGRISERPEVREGYGPSQDVLKRSWSVTDPRNVPSKNR